MKQIYISLLALVLAHTAKAQTLTAAANEPASGDMNTYKMYDSLNTGSIPKSTGAGQTWNFSTFTPNASSLTTKSYTTAASVPQASMFPGATLVETKAGGGDMLFWKSVPSPTNEFHLLGIHDPSINSTISFTDAMVVAQWPISMGYSNTDVAVGGATLGTSGSSNGTIVTNASGTGTIQLPGGAGTFNNILQVKTTQTLIIGLASVTVQVMSTGYDYYHSSQKFPMFKVSYEATTLTPVAGSPTISTKATIEMNNILFTGINEQNFDAAFRIFPNPAKETFHINLNNNNQDKGVIEIYNNTGNVVKRVDLGNSGLIDQNISITDLSSGIYLVKTSLGVRNSTRKLVIE